MYPEILIAFYAALEFRYQYKLAKKVMAEDNVICTIPSKNKRDEIINVIYEDMCINDNKLDSLTLHKLYFDDYCDMKLTGRRMGKYSLDQSLFYEDFYEKLYNERFAKK